MKFFTKLWEIITELNWTVAGTVLVLITLSGTTKETGLLIFAIATALNVMDILIRKSKESDDE